MGLNNLRTTLLVFISFVILPPVAMTQEGIDPGFDADPVEIPSVPKTAPRRVTSMDLLTLREVQGISISPDGKWVAFVLDQAVYETNHYRSGMFVISTEKGSKPVCLGNAGPLRWDDINQRTREDPVWSADSRYVYRTMKNDGSWQLWRWDREGGAPVRATHVQYDVQSFSLSPDGTRLLLTVALPAAIDKKKLAEDGILYDGSFEGTGQPIIDRLAATPSGTETWIQEIRSGVAHKATSDEQRELEVSGQIVSVNGEISSQFFTKKEIEEGYIYSYMVSPDRKKVAYSKNEDNPSKSEWNLYPLLVKTADGGSPVTVVTWPWYPGLYWWSADSKEIYYTDDDADNPSRKFKIMAVSATGGKPRVLLESDGLLGIFSVDHSKRLVACYDEDNESPARIVLIDLSNGQMRTLIDINPELQTLQINPAKRIDVSDQRGNHFWGHLVLPAGYEPGKRYPLVITTYVDYAGFLLGAVGNEYPIHVFAANGFAVLNFNAWGRQSNPKPGDFDSTLRLWQAPNEALQAVVAKLSEMGIVDSSRVAITGLSYGATVINYGISHTNTFRVAIESGPAYDPIMYYLATDEQRSEALLHWQNMGSPDGDTAPNWQKVSAALNADHIHTPLLINASAEEWLDEAQLVAALRDRKKPVEMFIYQDERHEKNQPRHRYSVYERNVDWLNFWLLDKEDPNPAKTDQYKRWRELRKLDEKDREQLKASAP
jgi:dipeptidyl aminopeptidase/acylaminoacyl peptidase